MAELQPPEGRIRAAQELLASLVGGQSSMLSFASRFGEDALDRVLDDPAGEDALDRVLDDPAGEETVRMVAWLLSLECAVAARIPVVGRVRCSHVLESMQGSCDVLAGDDDRVQSAAFGVADLTFGVMYCPDCDELAESWRATGNTDGSCDLHGGDPVEPWWYDEPRVLCFTQSRLAAVTVQGYFCPACVAFGAERAVV